MKVRKKISHSARFTLRGSGRPEIQIIGKDLLTLCEASEPGVNAISSTAFPPYVDPRLSTLTYVWLRAATCGDVRLRAATYGPSPSLTYIRLRLATWRRQGPATRRLRQFIAILVLHRFNAYNESKPTREFREKGCIQK
ncbi:hypothetical protein C8R44DRAFT_725203 [Mycena epipterygia]|nr:hypothetical protein C8R44DRAFT_725203 [Mycena epipterygia]